jgi:hypothetical protein
MGKRGPKPPDYGLLTIWEFEFYKAFRLLRDGYALPARQRLPVSSLTRIEANQFLAVLKRLSAEDYFLASRKLAVECGQHQNLERPPMSVDIDWAESQRSEEIVWLERLIRPKRPKAQMAGMKVWKDLLRADTYADVRKVCGRWSRLPSVLGAGLTPFPDHVRTNAAQFLAMKRNERFPTSAYGDDARIDFLARGMAGVMVNLSPMTGDERLRNLKHGPGGPFWVEGQGDKSLPRDRQYCGCWRCSLNQGEELKNSMQTAFDDGFRAFIEIAAKTKAPAEWKKRRLRRFMTAVSQRV